MYMYVKFCVTCSYIIGYTLISTARVVLLCRVCPCEMMFKSAGNSYVKKGVREERGRKREREGEREKERERKREGEREREGERRKREREKERRIKYTTEGK